MNKFFISVGLLAAAIRGAAAESYLVMKGSGNVALERSRAAPRPAKTGWYVGANGTLGFANWIYDVPALGMTENAPMKPQIGMNAVIGKIMAPKLRGELELGYTGIATDGDTFEEGGDGSVFKESAAYGAFNAIYGAGAGFYAGAGIGLALVQTEYRDGTFAIDASKSSISPMGQIKLGYELEMTPEWALDLGAKGGFYYGAGQNYQVMEMSLGLIWILSAQMGLKYKF